MSWRERLGLGWEQSTCGYFECSTWTVDGNGMMTCAFYESGVRPCRICTERAP